MNNLSEYEKKLIEEHEIEEQEYFESVIEDLFKEDLLDILIAERTEEIDLILNPSEDELYYEEQFFKKDYPDFEPTPVSEHLDELYYVCSDIKHQKQISDVKDYIDYP